MMKKIALAVVALIIVVGLVLFFWARSIFTGDYVREAVAAQLSQRLGQPVTIATLGAGVFPRVTLDLGDVTIGQPARIQVKALHVGTNVGALLSRRIEHADIRVDGARIELPLPSFGAASPASGTTPGGGSAPGSRDAGASPDAAAPAGESGGAPPVTVVSIDEVVLHDVEVVSQGHTLHADIEAVPQGDGFTLRRATLTADDTEVQVGGAITNIAGPVGALTLTAGTVDLDRLLLFLGAFAAGAQGTGAGATAADGGAPAVAGPPAHVEVTLETERAKSGALVLEGLSGKAVATNEGVSVDPIGFGLFDGRYDGMLAASLTGREPTFRGRATLKGVDVAKLVEFAGNPGTLSGRLSGSTDLTGAGASLAAAIRSARGTARLDIVDGVVPHLNLVRQVVLATSGRADSTAQAGVPNTGGERFSRLGATLAIAGGEARTGDLLFESPDVQLAGKGSIALDGSAVNVAGLIQLSRELTAQAGRDLVRYTAEDGKVTLPATVTGSASNLSVRVDLANAATRALRNKASEEVKKALERNLGGLFKRPPK